MQTIQRKKRIVLWGCTTAIWTSVQTTINPFTADIVAFIDSDPGKQGLMFHGLPICSHSSFDFTDIDHIIICAYSALQKIRLKLIESGVPVYKIAPYITDGMINYYVGDISEMSWKETLVLYFEPERMEEIASDYISLSKRYEAIEPLHLDTDHWSRKGHLISHACGGYVSGIPLMYTNSKEALEYTFKFGFRLMECDVLRMPDGEWYLAHSRSEMYRAKEYKFTQQSLPDLLTAMSVKSEVFCLFDVKWKTVEEFGQFIKNLDTLLNMHPDQSLKKRLIIEVYDEQTIQITYEHGFEMFFTEYRNPQKDCLMETVVLCDRYHIPVIGMGIHHFRQIGNRVSVYLNKGIKIYVFSVDSPDEYSRIRQSGAYGVFTNNLAPALL